MGDKDQEKSEELEKQFDQEAKDAKSNGMIIGYACSKHEHINYDMITPFCISEYIWFLGNCEGKGCDGKITEIPVQLARMEPIANGVQRRVVKTKDQSGKWTKGRGEEWKEYSKNVYFKLKTD
ncbi:hypothetical protein H9L39_17078, partial [Fusarium oxysporum f. sp. albedinis]